MGLIRALSENGQFLAERALKRASHFSAKRRRRNTATHQVKPSTESNRYPEIFAAVRDHYDGGRGAGFRILSFGCSSGEECVSLRSYFPEADVFGTDINRWCLYIGRMKNRDPKIRLFYSTPENVAAHGPYHVIFCMSVFCRWPESKGAESIAEIYPFAHFERSLNQLDAVLHSRGAIVLYNTNYDFCDTSLVERYRGLGDARVRETGFVHRFDRHGTRSTGPNSTECVFIKR